MLPPISESRAATPPFHERVLELRETLGIPKTLSAMGVTADRLDDLTAMALDDPTAGGKPGPHDGGKHAETAGRVFLMP